MSHARDRLRPYLGALRRACTALVDNPSLSHRAAVNLSLIAEGFTLHTIPVDIHRGLLLAVYRISNGIRLKKTLPN